MAINPIQNPEAYDRPRIGGTLCPGLAKVGEFKRAAEYDIKKGKGAYGATVTYVGRPPAKGEITFYLWEPRHWDEWETFRNLFKYDPTKKSVNAVDISYPSLARININSVVTESIGNEQHEGLMLWSIKVELLEYFPPPPQSAVSTPTGSFTHVDPSGTNRSGTQPDPAAAAQQAEIAKLLAEAQKP